ncbi:MULTISPECIES: CDP-alcohol phosphatidyltransferase family protein [Micrococcaceae]|uniref:CDP-alcohol phosphatidyltransferase family protein n=1 Tax=Micrococcaceae TaxID=1268 RepID=UPI00268F4617
MAAFAHTLGLTPNQVTLVSAVFTFSGIVLLAVVPPSGILAIAVWLLLALGYAWDSADGQVARLRGGGSVAGEWLDHFVDAVKISSLHLAVLVGWYRYFPLNSDVWLFAPIGFAIVGAVTFFAMILNDLLKVARGAPKSMETGGSSPLRSVLLLPTDYGILCLSFILWGFPVVFVGVYSLLALACALFLVLAASKWFKDMKSI